MVEEIIIHRSDPDKNGTVIEYKKVPCQRCGGTGVYKYTSMGRVVDGVCFLCKGEKLRPKKEKIYTKEHRAKLDRQNQRRNENNRRKRNEELYKKYGFETGVIYVVTEQDIRTIQYQLAEAGATYDTGLGWFFTYEQDNYQTEKVAVDEFAKIDETGNILLDITGYNERQREKQIKESRERGKFVGEIKQRMEGLLRREKLYSYDTVWGVTWIHYFTDEDGNALVWKTKKYLADEYEYDDDEHGREWCDDSDEVWGIGKQRLVRFTIKEHGYYDNKKQTLIKNVKFCK